jgi:hypothetical protein
MLISIIITFTLLAAFGKRLGSGRQGELIVPRPYNNQYSDASGARDERFL